MIVAACALAAGCTSLASRTRDRDRDPDRRLPAGDRDPDRPWWLEGSETGAAAQKGKAKVLPDGDARADRDSIVAGEVVDGGRGPAAAAARRTSSSARPTELTPAGARGNVGGRDGRRRVLLHARAWSPGQTYILSVVREVDGRRSPARCR